MNACTTVDEFNSGTININVFDNENVFIINPDNQNRELIKKIDREIVVTGNGRNPNGRTRYPEPQPGCNIL